MTISSVVDASSKAAAGSAGVTHRAAGTGPILVLIVAYEAGEHVLGTLQRIPRSLLEDPRVRLLCIDDASTDDTYDLARHWVAERGLKNFDVRRNPVNLRYGGNQKVGYRIALAEECDFVILLHGDGQYAPELLPRFIEAWQSEHADVVLGTRMHSLRSARAGGMPWHKILGNRALTWVQNRLTGLGLSEFHTGYRGYSTSFLKRVPFESNTDDFHFDTEILLQAAAVGAKIVELEIPTHYGDEVSRVNCLTYSWNVLRTTLRFRFRPS
jgi:glycosyltransferase involved in cell wall biosynthesis